jgi:hypothetical protein
VWGRRETATGFCMGLKEKSPINRPRCRRKETITMVFEKLDGIV